MIKRSDQTGGFLYQNRYELQAKIRLIISELVRIVSTGKLVYLLEALPN